MNPGEVGKVQHTIRQKQPETSQGLSNEITVA
jgi:hypothetical protein